MCKDNRQTITGDLIKAGLVRITEPAFMSKTVIGETHDGDYPLRRYSKIVEVNRL